MATNEKLVKEGLASAAEVQLDQLLAESAALSAQIEANEKQTRELIEMKEEMQRLKRRHLELEYRVYLQDESSQTLADLLLKQNGDTPLRTEISEEIIELAAKKAAKSVKKVKQDMAQLAYRLAGSTAFCIDDSHFGVSFATCFQGKYYETYYILFESREGRHSVRKHTIPHFVPLSELSTKFLSRDLRLLNEFMSLYAVLTHEQQFLDAVSGYLDAYVSRRESFLQLQREEKDSMRRVVTSKAYDIIEFAVAFDEKRYEVKLSYGDLLCCLPTRCSVVEVDMANTYPLPELEEVFLSNPLRTAYRKCFIDAEEN